MTKSNKFNPSDNQIIGMAAFGVTSVVIGLWGLWALFFRTSDYVTIWPWVSAAVNAVFLIIMMNAKSSTWKSVVAAYKPTTYLLIWLFDMSVVAIASYISEVSPSEIAAVAMFVSGMIFVWFNFGYAALWKEQTLKGVLDGDLVKNVKKLGFYGN